MSCSAHRSSSVCFLLLWLLTQGSGHDGQPLLQLPLRSAEILAWLVDLSALPPMRTVAALAEQCPCPPEAMRLKQLATEESYKEKVCLRLVPLAGQYCCLGQPYSPLRS